MTNKKLILKRLQKITLNVRSVYSHRCKKIDPKRKGPQYQLPFSFFLIFSRLIPQAVFFILTHSTSTKQTIHSGHGFLYNQNIDYAYWGDVYMYDRRWYDSNENTQRALDILKDMEDKEWEGRMTRSLR